LKDKPLEKSELSTSLLSAYLVQLLKTYSILHWRMPIDGIRSGSSGVRRKNPLAGFPDYAGVTQKGRFWAAEIKGPGDRLSEKQNAWIQDLRGCSAFVEVLSTYDEVVDFVGRLIHN